MNNNQPLMSQEDVESQIAQSSVEIMQKSQLQARNYAANLRAQQLAVESIAATSAAKSLKTQKQPDTPSVS